MPAVAADDIWGLPLVLGSRETLIAMGMARQDRMGPNARRRTCGIDFLQHQRASAMSAGIGTLCTLCLGDIRRVVDRDEQRTIKLFAVYALQCSFQVSELRLSEIWVRAPLVGDDPGVFQDAAKVTSTIIASFPMI